MRFLLDANMPRSAVSVLERNGHDAVHVRDTVLKDAPDERIAAFTRTEQRVIVTRDLDFADVRRYAPEGSPGYLVLRVPDSWVASEIVELLERFLGMPGLVDQIPGHLAILDPRQVRFRPALDSEIDGKG
jgi:predicted nuclease of predicted toxin-antitoxin system